MKTAFNERNWLTWLVKVRVIVITFLLVVELAIVTLTPTNVNRRFFVLIIVCWYVAAAAHMVSTSTLLRPRMLAKLQLASDLIFTTAVIYASGGIDTTFNFLYPLLIILASILVSPMMAYWTAAVSFILLGSVLEMSYFGMIASYATTHTDLKSLQAVIFINGFAYLTIAYLAGRLSYRLRQADVELADASFALEDMKALHQHIVDSISGGLALTDLDGRVKLLNRAGKSLLERDESECTGQLLREFFLDELPTAEGVMAEARALLPSGEKKFLRVNISPLKVAERGQVGRLYSFDDLTQVRLAEREQRRRERLAAVGRLSAGIAHEIRNPLSSIAGSVRVLASISALSEDERALVDIVNRESERLNGIITDFLAYARESQHVEEDVELCSLLGESLALFRNRPEAVEVAESYEAAEAWVRGDSGKLRQVVWNLCENAARALSAHPPAGEPGRFEVTLESQGEGLWRIRFADNGPGIDSELGEKLFEPFQSAFAGGSGLGLAIVYQIVRAHQGSIRVNAAREKGCEFIVELPKTAAPAKAQE